MIVCGAFVSIVVEEYDVVGRAASSSRLVLTTSRGIRTNIAQMMKPTDAETAAKMKVDFAPRLARAMAGGSDAAKPRMPFGEEYESIALF